MTEKPPQPITHQESRTANSGLDKKQSGDLWDTPELLAMFEKEAAELKKCNDRCEKAAGDLLLVLPKLWKFVRINPDEYIGKRGASYDLSATATERLEKVSRTLYDLGENEFADTAFARLLRPFGWPTIMLPLEGWGWSSSEPEKFSQHLQKIAQERTGRFEEICRKIIIYIDNLPNKPLPSISEIVQEVLQTEEGKVMMDVYQEALRQGGVFSMQKFDINSSHPTPRPNDPQYEAYEAIRNKVNAAEFKLLESLYKADWVESAPGYARARKYDLLRHLADQTVRSWRLKDKT